MTTLHIKNGHLIDPANGIDGLQDLFIADGKVLAVGSVPAGFKADTTFDAAVQRTKDLSFAGKPLLAITSTPCFEVWLLLHFQYSDQPFYPSGKKSVGDQVVTVLKSMHGFSKYGKGQSGIYAQLKEKLTDALANAERLREQGMATGSINPATDVDRLVKDIQAIAP